jgi:hypothetical protein
MVDCLLRYYCPPVAGLLYCPACCSSLLLALLRGQAREVARNAGSSQSGKLPQPKEDTVSVHVFETLKKGTVARDGYKPGLSKPLYNEDGSEMNEAQARLATISWKEANPAIGFLKVVTIDKVLTDAERAEWREEIVVPSLESIF